MAGAAAMVAVAALDLAGGALARANGRELMEDTKELQIPASIKAEHGELHAELRRLAQVPGRVGEAARALAELMHPHFVREEQIALPPLGLLGPLSRGEPGADAATILAMTDSLRAELPQMLAEHEAIGAATRRLGEAGRSEHDARAQVFAEQLLRHAQSEEEVLYPAAILVGEVVRTRAAGRPPGS